MGPFGGGSLKRSYTTLDYIIQAPRFIRLFWRLLGDKRVSPFPKLVLWVGIIYFVSPLDLIPDAIPVLGYIDDAAVLSLVMAAIRSDLEKFQEWEGTIEM